MREQAALPLALVAVSLLGPALPATATTNDVQEAISLLKSIQADQCEQKSLRGRALAAHQAHDEEALGELGPQLEALNARLKPATSRLDVLTKSIQASSEDRAAFETAQLEMTDCD